MSIAERKLKEKEEMRKLILDGARKVFKEKGEIFQELHEEGFRLLLSKMQVLAHVSDPYERLKAMGAVFIDFAMHNKDFYNLMFIVEEPLKKKAGGESGSLGN